MNRVYGFISWLSGSAAIAAMILAVFVASGRESKAAAGTTPCAPTDRTSGSKPCYDVAGAQCKYNQKDSTCTTTTDNNNCTCAAI